MRPLLPALVLVLALFADGTTSLVAVAEDDAPIVSEQATFRVVPFAIGLEFPWGGDFLPDGSMLVTERPGRLRRIDEDGALSPPIAGVPAVDPTGQGGLLDVALAPDFATTREIYLCHSAVLPRAGALTRLSRARLSEDMPTLEGLETLLDATPAQWQGRESFGCRLAFGPADGKLYLATGDRFVMVMRAQRLEDLAGKVLRLERDGRPAEGNPFLGRADARPEIWSYGHRNPQGLVFNPATGSLWAVELGPRGGDEVNLVRAGANYGWPLVTQGIHLDGKVIASRQPAAATATATEEPLRVWTSGVSPSGAVFYDGEAFPGWRGSLFLAGLNPPALLRLSTEGDRVIGEERLLAGVSRFRHVLVGPDGLLYILTDQKQGRILRLEPVPPEQPSVPMAEATSAGREGASEAMELPAAAPAEAVTPDPG